MIQQLASQYDAMAADAKKVEEKPKIAVLPNMTEYYRKFVDLERKVVAAACDE